ncbi:MAG: type II toxin-antitoxin system HipA family toxin [Alphaproteobacteria bacterium]
MTSSLTVWWDGRDVGRLSLDRHGEMRFAYSEAWLADETAPSVSFSLPKRHQPFSRREARPFFEGLLPEEEQREAIAAALGISKGNEFRLLESLGGEVAGALTLWPTGEVLPDTLDAKANTPLSETDLIALLDRLPKRPFLAGERGLRLSLAGAQLKLPVVLVDDQIALPAPGQPTTHILKPPIARFESTTENEAFAMRLASKLGLDVAAVEIRAVAGRPYLLVERYDRTVGSDGFVRRLHQEDFCQALGVFTERKYASEGGPTFKTSFELVRRACTRPAGELLKLLDAAIVQVLIGNADAHGKNYSLLHRDDGIVLAPLYDILCTVAYPDLSPTFAMKIARRGTLADLKPGDWDSFAKDAGLAPPFVRRRVTELADAALECRTEVAEELAQSHASELALRDHGRRIEQRAAELAKTV